MARAHTFVIILTCILPHISAHSKQFHLLRNVLSSSLDDIHREQKNLKGEILAEVHSRIVPHIRQSLQQEILSQVRREIQAAVQERPVDPVEVDITRGVKQEIQREVTDVIEGPLKNALKNELIRSLREEIQTEIHKGLASFLRKSLKEELSQQLKRQIKEEVQSKMVGHLKDSLREDVVKQIEKDGPLKVQTKLTPYQRRILKQSIMKEVKVELDKAQKVKGESVKMEDVMKDVRKEINRVHRNSPETIRKDEIMKDIRKEIAKSHQRRDVQRMLKDEIMKDVKKEIHKIHKKNLDMTTEDTSPYDRKMREYVDKVNGKVMDTSNELRIDLANQESDMQALRKRVSHLEKKHRSTKRQTDPKRKITRLEKATPSPEPDKKDSKRKKKLKVDPPKKVELETAREIPTVLSGLDIPKFEKEPDYKGEGIVVYTRTRTKHNLPDKDSLLVAKQNHSAAYFAELSSGTVNVLSRSLGQYVGDVTYDAPRNTIYWSDWRVDAIFSYNFEEEDQVVLKPNILTYGIEVDTRGRVIVCSDYWSRTVFTMDIDMGGDSSRSMRQITKISEGNPMRIALDVANKKIYVSISYTKILQVNYDNGKTKTVVEIPRGFINGLGVNPKTRTLYFNSFTSIMGKNVTRRRHDPFKVSHSPGKEPSDILVHDGNVYIAYYNSEDVDIIREDQTTPVRFSHMPFSSRQHLRASLCFIPAH